MAEPSTGDFTANSLEGIERVKHAWPAGCWLDSTVYLDLLFSDFARISRIFIWQAAADQSAAAGSIMKFPGNRIAAPGRSRMCAAVGAATSLR